MARTTDELKAYRAAREAADEANERLRDAAAKLAARVERDHAPAPERARKPRRSARRAANPPEASSKKKTPRQLKAVEGS